MQKDLKTEDDQQIFYYLNMEKYQNIHIELQELFKTVNKIKCKEILELQTQFQKAKQEFERISSENIADRSIYNTQDNFVQISQSQHCQKAYSVLKKLMLQQQHLKQAIKKKILNKANLSEKLSSQRETKYQIKTQWKTIARQYQDYSLKRPNCTIEDTIPNLGSQIHQELRLKQNLEKLENQNHQLKKQLSQLATNQSRNLTETVQQVSIIENQKNQLKRMREQIKKLLKDIEWKIYIEQQKKQTLKNELKERKYTNDKLKKQNNLSTIRELENALEIGKELKMSLAKIIAQDKNWNDETLIITNQLFYFGNPF